MQKKYIVRLSKDERSTLEEVVKKLKGTGQKVRRAQVLLKADAVVIAVAGIALYRRKQNQCSIDVKRKRKNMILASVMIPLLAVGFFLTLEKVSSWYFDTYVMAEFEQSETGD